MKPHRPDFSANDTSDAEAPTAADLTEETPGADLDMMSEAGAITGPEAELARAVDARLRAEAELINARRRAAREIDEAERRGAERTLAPVLAVADDLDRALEAAEQAGEGSGALAQGVALVLTRLVEKLAAFCVTPIVPVNEPFEPHFHEALTHSPHPTVPAGHVFQVIGRGWRQGDRLIRPARVLVSSGPPARGATGPGSA